MEEREFQKETTRGESKICITKNQIKHLIKMVHDLVTLTRARQYNNYLTGFISGPP